MIYAKAVVESSRVIDKTPRFVFNPSEKTNTYNTIVSILKPMLADNTSSFVDIEAGFAKHMLSHYATNAPKGLNIGSNVCCHSVGVQVTTYRVYTMDRAAAYSPEDFRNRYGHYPRLYVIDKKKGTSVVGEMKGNRKYSLGRAGGDYGWDKTRDLVAFALASFRHNFEALLAAFSSRPSLPCTDYWDLPNLVNDQDIASRESSYHAKIVAPPVAVPPASYTFDFMVPRRAVTFRVAVATPNETESYVEFWDSAKNDMAKPLKVIFPKGTSETWIRLRGFPIKSGYFNINPVNSEMRVTYVKLGFFP